MRYKLNIQMFGGRGAGSGRKPPLGGDGGGVPMMQVAVGKDLAKQRKANDKVAEQLASKLGIQTNSKVLDYVDSSLFKETAKIIQDFKKEYPDAKFSVINATSKSNVLASTHGYDLNMSDIYFYDKNSLKAIYNNSVKDGFHPKGTTYKDIIHHELGHVLVYNSGRRAGDIVLKAYEKMTGKSQSAYSKNLHKERKNLSGYALESWDETVAEAYADYKGNGSKAREFSKAIVKELLRK